MAVVIQIVCWANGQPSENDGCYVHDYEAGEPGSPGKIRVSQGIEGAKVFADHGEALEYWRQVNGVRTDGKPNRPLTAFTVMFKPLD